jgi:hypothetical protein
MKSIAKFWQAGIKFLFLFVIGFLLAVAGCNIVAIRPGGEPLPSVDVLPPPQLPDWIESVTPLGEAQPRSQILIRFKEPLIPLESLDSDDRSNLLNKFEIIPPLPGQFRFLTPRMVGFQFEKALPKATRVRVTLKAGLQDLSKHELAEDLAWTFNTEKIKITDLPNPQKEGEAESESEPIDINPTLNFTSNVELDLDSVQENLKLIADGKDAFVGVKVTPKEDEETASAETEFDPSQRNWSYIVKPEKTLAKDTKYRLEFSPGLHPANGNLLSEAKFIGRVSTYSQLTFKKLEFYGQPDAGGAYGRFVKGIPQLVFNNGLVAESALKNITIEPAPKKSIKSIRAYDGDTIVSLNPWALEPNTKYNINIGADLKDRFGQTLGKPVTLNYETGDVAGDLWTPSGLNIFPSGSNLQLNIETVNLPEGKYQAAFREVRPTDLVYTDSAYPTGEGKDLLPNSASWSSFVAGGKKNQTFSNVVALQEKLGSPTGMLAYGVKAKTNRYLEENKKENWREAEYYGLVQLTNLGVFAQAFPDRGLVKINHLNDGSPVSNATVEIYQSKLEAKTRLNSSACAVSQTDPTGILILEGAAWQSCFQGKEYPELLVIARENEDWAFSRIDQYSGSYEYGIYSDWDDRKPKSRGTIFSDRQLYQPEETAWFTAVAYYLQDGVLKQDKNTAYKVTLSSAEGGKENLGTYTTNQFGTFSFELPLAKDRELGYYYIEAEAKNGNKISLSSAFRVAEFNPPNFKVDLSLDKEFAIVGDRVTATGKGKYLFGYPVEGGKVKYYVTRTPSNFIPKGWEEFSFGRSWFWPEEKPEVTTDVLESNLVLDDLGNSSQIINIADDLPYPMTYRIEAQVSDVSNLSVSNTQTFTALPTTRLIGLQSDFVADRGKPFPIQVIVTDPTGKVVEGERVNVELQQMQYSSVTQLQEGSSSDRHQVEYKTVAQENVRSASTPQTVNLTPPESGSYRIHASFGGNEDLGATDSQIWVTGNEEVYWGDRYNNNRLEIKLDKEKYQPGELATALIQSPYPEAELYFAVVRHDTIYSTIVKASGGAPKIEFQVTPEMLPNAAVEAVLVRQGESIEKVEAGSVPDLVRIGFASFNVNLDEKYLKVEVTPAAEKQQPGTQQTIQLQLKDKQDNPVRGQFTVMVVNEAILQLTGYRPPDLVETVYAQQEITTRLNDNRSNVVLTPQASPLDKGWGFGGGASAAEASTRLRKDFQSLAYYNGSVLTDNNGSASISFSLPDDLTTWRVMAVATDEDWHFGNNSDATFTTTQALVTNPILPQFARRGDRFDVGVSVTNTDKETGNLQIDPSVSGSVRLVDKSNKLQTQVESGTQAYRFRAIATEVGEAKVQFTTQLNNQSKDAFIVPIEVKDYQISESVIESGVVQPSFVTGGDEKRIPINIDNKILSDAGGLEVYLSSTLIPEIIAPGQKILQEESLEFLEPIASKLAIAADLQLLTQQYQQKLGNINPTQQATQALDNLQKLQKADGGFAFFPQAETSDPFVTPYAAESIALAKEAGFTVNSGITGKLEAYLRKILANPSQNDSCKSETCKTQIRLEALLALSKLDDVRKDFLQSIYEQNNNLDLVSQIKLARYLSLFPEWQEKARTLAKQIETNTLYQTGRSTTVNLPENWRWFNSQTTTQAQILRLNIALNSSQETLDRLVQGLLSQRRNGNWGSIYDNAQALTALVKYSRGEASSTEPTPPNFTATVKLGPKQLGKVKFEGYSKPNYVLKVPMSQLPRGQNELVVSKSGEGNLHYLTAFNYRLKGNQPGRFNGLRVTRYIRPVAEDKVLQKMSIYAPDKSLSINAGEVFDIGLEIISDRPVDQVVITDPLPAGLEAIDASLATATTTLQPKQDSWEIGYRQFYKDKVVAYSDRLQAGVYSLHYLVRSISPGVFDWPGAEAHLQYAPEEFGRCASTILEVKDGK